MISVASPGYLAARIGCANCDLVASTVDYRSEEELHQWMCPRCGANTIHHYPVFGSWPSDYDEPPCQQKPEEEFAF